MTPPDSTPTVRHMDDKHRYEIHVDGRRAGFTAYRDFGHQRVFYHTEIDDSFADQGLAAQVVHYALSDVRDTGRRIVAVCPYVAKYLSRHEAFADYADPVTPELRRRLEQALRH